MAEARLRNPSRLLPSAADARELARRRLPRLIFDFIDGAAGEGATARRNEEAFAETLLMPRVLVDVAVSNLTTHLFGKDYAVPFGIAPMGMCDLAWPGTDRAFARLAAEAGLPICVSTASSTPLEDMIRLAEGRAWFQLYVTGSIETALGFVERARAAAYDTLILTVDVPKLGRRPRDLRNGFQTPFRFTPPNVMDFALHPRWSLGTLAAGIPRMANYDGLAQSGGYDRQAARRGADWALLERLRDLWKGRLVVKGVLSAEDAARIAALGCDAVWISNHGGRQLDSAPATFTALAEIRSALPENFPLILDGGVRNGEDIVKAIAAGASFAMLGRPFLFASAAAGPDGPARLAQTLREEISVTLAQIGAIGVADLAPSVLRQPSGQAGSHPVAP
jgi:L-lactate dehydrogenase (cytochrome)